MNGWIISFLSDSAQNTANCAAHREEYGSLSWSPYDRICIQKAESFEELCTSSSVVKTSEKRWPGSERTMHILPDSQNTAKDMWELSQSPDKIIENEYSFYCIVTLRYSGAVSCHKNNPDYVEVANDIRKKMYTALDQFINDNHLLCSYRGFLPLSVEDAVIILCADDLATINLCIKFLKILKIKCNNEDYLFYSLSNFSGLNDLQTNNDPKMNAIVKLNLYPYRNEDEAISELNSCEARINSDKVKVRSSCFFIELDHNEFDLVSFYKQNTGIFNGNSLFYRRYVKSSRTYWVEEKQSQYCLGTGQTLDVCLADCQSSEENTPSTELDSKIASFIVSEFDRIMQTPRFEAWKPILKNQKNIFERMVSCYEQNKINQDLCEIIDFTQDSLSIINQACSPAYEIPYHNHFYSGSHNDLLKMYYGIISAIFKMGFQMAHKNADDQHPIYFAINFESTISTYSTMFTMNGSRDRFVVFFLPSDNLYNYPKMVPNLIHEVFHYIAPFDRRKRAENILKVIIVKILMESVHISFEHSKGSLLSDEQNILEQYFASKEFIDKVLKSTIDFVQNCEPCFFSETSSYVSKKYFDVFDSFRSVYQFVYKEIRTLIREEYKNSSFWNFKKYQSKRYDNGETIKEIFSSSPLKLRINDKSKDAEYETEFFSYDFCATMFDFMQEVMLNAKEVFCDICIARILDMNLEDYILMHYNALAQKSNRSELLENLKTGQSSDMNIISSELRLLMMIFFFVDKEKTDNGKEIETSKIASWINKRLAKISSLVGDQELFDAFRDRLHRIFIDSCQDYEIYIDLMKEITCFGSVMNSFKDNSIRELKKNLIAAYRDDVKSNINIDSINYFTHFYYDTSSISNNGSTAIGTMPYFPVKNQFYDVVSSVSEYVDNVLSRMKDDNFKFFKPWFRGMCNRNFEVTPSLFRVADPKLSLYANQANIIKYAYEKTLFFDDLWKTSIREQMCFLQHYGMSTNLLDFSMDMLVALHFALNPDNPEDRKKIASGDFEPAVYVFDPIEYSRAVIALKEQQINEDNLFFKGASNISPIEHTLGKTELDKYFVTDMSIRKMSEHTRDYNKPYIPDERGDDYPVPIIVPQSNERIHIQNGTFLAYSLDAKPSKEKGTGIDRYNYLSLQSMQKRYSDLLVRLGCEERKFLYRISINPNSVSQINKELKMMSITEGRLYPEFSTIFREGMDEYRTKFQK